MSSWFIGVGQTEFTGANDRSLTDLGSSAARAAVRDAGIEQLRQASEDRRTRPVAMARRSRQLRG